MTIRSRAPMRGNNARLLRHESRAPRWTSPAVAAAAGRRRLARVLAVGAILLAASCAQDARMLSDEAFRNVVPATAELLDDAVDDGSSLTVDGERTVLRTFAPIPPAEASDVLEVLVTEGENDGWQFTERSATLAVGTKEIDGRPWMVSIAVRDDTVQQLFAGR